MYRLINYFIFPSKLVWYRKPQQKNSARKYGTESAEEQTGDESAVSKESERCFSTSRHESHDKTLIVHDSEADKSVTRQMSYVSLVKKMAAWQVAVCLFEVGALATLTGITASYIGFEWILFVPCVVILIIIGTILYRDYAGETFKCWEDTLDSMHYKIFGETVM